MFEGYYLRLEVRFWCWVNLLMLDIVDLHKSYTIEQMWDIMVMKFDEGGERYVQILPLLSHDAMRKP